MGESEPVRTNHSTGVQDAVVADDAVVIDAYAGIQDAVPAHLHVRSEIYERIDVRPLAHPGRKGDGATERNPGPETVSALAAAAEPVEEIEQDRNTLIDILHLDHRGGYRTGRDEIPADQQDAGLRVVDVFLVFRIGVKTDVTVLGLLDAGRSGDNGFRVADGLAAEQLCQHLRGYLHKLLQN